jgi:acyl-CoA thioesterase I
VSNSPAIVFLGDSLTAGRGLEENEALPAVVQQMVDASVHKYHVINGGRSGDTSAGGLARLDWYLRDSVNPSVLVIGLGSNDAMRGLAVDQLEANLRAIIHKAKTARPQIRILLWELHTFPNLGAEYATAYAAVFPRVASDEAVELIPFPLADVAGQVALNQDDGIHPSVAGTRKVAERIWQVLEPKL